MAIGGGVHLDLVKRIFRDTVSFNSNKRDGLLRITDFVFPMYKAYIEPDMKMAHIRIRSKYNPINNINDPIYVCRVSSFWLVFLVFFCNFLVCKLTCTTCGCVCRVSWKSARGEWRIFCASKRRATRHLRFPLLALFVFLFSLFFFALVCSVGVTGSLARCPGHQQGGGESSEDIFQALETHVYQDLYLHPPKYDFDASVTEVRDPVSSVGARTRMWTFKDSHARIPT